MSTFQYAQLVGRIVARGHCPESLAAGIELRLMQKGEQEAAHRIRVARFVTWHPFGKAP